MNYLQNALCLVAPGGIALWDYEMLVFPSSDVEMVACLAYYETQVVFRTATEQLGLLFCVLDNLVFVMFRVQTLPRSMQPTLLDTL